MEDVPLTPIVFGENMAPSCEGIRTRAGEGISREGYMRLNKRCLVGLLAVAIGALVPGQASAASTVTPVAWGLDSPRGIGFYHGRMLVAEAGHGSDNPADCFSTGFGDTCIGNTSQVSWVNPTTHTPNPLVKGLFSIRLGEEGTIGASGLSINGGKILVQIGATPQEIPDRFTIGKDESGRLISVNPNNGSWRSVANVGARDFQFTLDLHVPEPTPGVYSPGTQEHDANPYGVLATGNGAYVADAGSNTLDFVSREGKITILNYDGWRDPNPNNFPSDSVPTCVARSGEALWVGELSGRLLRVEGKSMTLVTPKDKAGNPLLTHVTNCISDREGNLYFVNMFGPGIPFTSPSFFAGSVVKFNPEEGRASVVAGNLFTPNMAAIGPDGNLYVTAGSICPANVPANAPGPCAGGGKVLKISLPREENDNSD
ncbi:MAG: hypothetical protein AUI42_02925 [Actinobacteria bacterium 13_1_40CM_2_65_8]|nr:MAG: hypothetical protein AUI42_02925 [Actinobacteria bacterium 13_1_40CM_2_65_8]